MTLRVFVEPQFGATHDQLTAAARPRVRKACEAGGRDPRSMLYPAAQIICCATDQKQLAKRADATGRDLPGLRENGLAGTPEELLDKLGAFTDAGVERFYLQFLDISDLDHLRLVAEFVQPSASPEGRRPRACAALSQSCAGCGHG